LLVGTVFKNFNLLLITDTETPDTLKMQAQYVGSKARWELGQYMLLPAESPKLIRDKPEFDQFKFFLPFNSSLTNHHFVIAVSALLAVSLYKTQKSKFICTFTNALNSNTIHVMLFS
jgi:hypothetical protein